MSCVPSTSIEAAIESTHAQPPPRRSPVVRSLLGNLTVPVALAAAVLAGRFVITRGTVGAYNLDVTMLVGVAVVMAVSLQLINGFSGQFSLGHAGFMGIGAYLSAYPSLKLSGDLSDPARVALFYVGLFAAAGIAAVLLLALFLAARWSGRVHAALPVVLMIAIFGWIVWDVSAWAALKGSRPPPAYLAVSNTILLLQRLFDAIVWGAGERATAVSQWLPLAARAPVCFVVLLLGGGLCAAAAGLVVGLPTLRLRGDYLAIATLGFAEIIRVGIQNAEPLGGALGLNLIPTYTDFGWLFGAAVVTIVVVGRIAYSARGRAIQAVREDEVAAAAVGIDTTRQKVMAFVVGAFFAGVGGVLYAHYTGFITPADFGLLRSIEFVVMVTLGGLASISGAVVAAVVLTFLPELLRRLSRDVVEWRMVIYSLLLIAMMLLRPQGLLGGRELWPKRRGRRGSARVTSPVAGRAGPEAAAP